MKNGRKRSRSNGGLIVLPLLILLFSYFSSFGQQQVSLFGLTHLIDHQSINPSYIGKATFELSLFPFNSNIYSSQPNYRDFIGNPESSNVLTYPANKLSFGQENILRAGSSIETFRLTFQEKGWAISVHHASRAKGLVDYSGALLAVAINGNAPYIGQNISLDTDFEAFSYEELGIGAAIELGKFKIGGRFKYLSGHSAVNTLKSKLALYTDEDIYQLQLTTDYEVEVAGQLDRNLSHWNFGPIGINFTENGNAIVQQPDFLFNLSDDFFNFSGNHGFAFDLGLDWQLNEQWQITFSALDLGKINWKDNPRNYAANQVFEFDGLSLGQLTFDGQANISFENTQDSLKIIEFVKSEKPFSTTLPAQFYLGTKFKLNENWRFYATAYHTSFKNNDFSVLALGANYQLKKIINIGTAVTFLNEEPNIGLNASIDLGPIQLYGLTDNIVGLFQLENSRTMNARIGLSASFGTPK